VPVSHWIDTKTRWSIKKFVRTIRRYRTIEIQAGTHTITAEDPLPTHREAEAAANLGEWDIVRLAAGFSGEPVLGGGGVLGVFERLRGRGALQGAQAKELGQGDDDGGLAAEVDDLVGA
jgi:hypothetical protein